MVLKIYNGFYRLTFSAIIITYQLFIRFIRYARASYYDVVKLSYAIDMNLLSQ